ncbi:MAG: hypothetical protein OXI95_02970 [bacterium]|nr:hypothetical protein [Rhodospirillaceae bacterium]MDE0415884.1 hypothetical protein [bacterium]
MNSVTLGGHPAPGIIPQVPAEHPHDSLDDLDAAITIHVADFHQTRAKGRSAFHRFALAWRREGLDRRTLPGYTALSEGTTLRLLLFIR